LESRPQPAAQETWMMSVVFARKMTRHTTGIYGLGVPSVVQV